MDSHLFDTVAPNGKPKANATLRRLYPSPRGSLDEVDFRVTVIGSRQLVVSGYGPSTLQEE